MFKVFQYLQGWSLHSLPGQLMPVPGHPDSKNLFPCIHIEVVVFQFAPVTSFFVTGHHWKESLSILYAPSLQMFMHIDEPWACFFPGWTVPALSYDRCSSPFIILVAFLQNSFQYVCPHLSRTVEPRTGHSTPGMASENAEQRGWVFCHWN